MELEGIHHITCITGDAPQNVRFYAGTLGLRMVKKSVNQDDPTVYHLFYASDEGAAGSDITFFEYPGVARGRHGAGMIYRVRWRVASEASLDFWERRLESQGVSTKRDDGTLFFEDPEGLELEFAVVDTTDEPLRASHPEIPDEEGISRGASRGSFYAYDPAPAQRGVAGAGTVHHVAWSSTMEDHGEWRERVVAGGADVTPIIDRFWFRSIYFREPSGVLFEIATLGPGVTVDEPLETLGQKLVLPPDYEHLRATLEPVLTPLPDPRAEALAR